MRSEARLREVLSSCRRILRILGLAMKLKPQASGARGLFAFVVLSAVPLGASERDAVKAAVHPVCKTSTAKQWAHVPSRYRAWGTVFDPVRQRVVAFAKPLEPGREFVAVEWTGAGWSPFVPRSGSPVGDRPDGAIALNPGGSGFMVFAENGVTWVWDGEQWDEHFGLGPRGRTPAALVYDSNRDKVLLFGGRRESDHSQYFDDTWQWDGARWERVFSADSPSPRDAA